MYGHPGKKLLFMGGEFGQWDEWNFEKSLDWHLLAYEPHRGLQRYMRDLNRVYCTEPSLFEVDFDWKGFEWIDFHDSDSSIISFIRRAHNPKDFVVFVCNFTPVPRLDYRVGVPEPGYYREVLNSDSAYYGGSDLGNRGGITAEKVPCQERAFSIKVTAPPLSVLILKCGEPQ